MVQAPPPPTFKITYMAISWVMANTSITHYALRIRRQEHLWLLLPSPPPKH